MSKLNIVKRKAKALGATEAGISERKGKKYYVVYKGQKIDFGAKGYSDFLEHRDKERRDRYRKRHKAILKKDGKPAYLDKFSPSWWSYRILWITALLCIVTV